MKSKDLIWPLITGISFVFVLLSLFIAFISFTNPISTTTAGLFADLAYLESAFLITIGQIAIIVSLVALAISALLMLVKGAKSKSKNKNLKILANILKIVLVLMAVAIAVVFILLFNANTATLLTVSGAVGFYFAVIGTALGAVSAIIGLRK